MKQVLKTISVFLVVVLIAAFSLNAVEKPPVDVLKAAKAGLVDFVRISKDASLKKSVVDFGFRLYTVKPLILMKKRTRSLEEAVVPTNVWKFVVKSKGKATILITVDKVDGKWVAVSFGAKGIAGEMSDINRTWQKEAGYNVCFVRVYQAKADFIQVSKKKEVLGYIPLESAKKYLQHSSKKTGSNTLLYNHEIVAPLKEVVGKVLLKKDLSSGEVQNEK